MNFMVRISFVGGRTGKDKTFSDYAVAFRYMQDSLHSGVEKGELFVDIKGEWRSLIEATPKGRKI